NAREDKVTAALAIGRKPLPRFDRTNPLDRPIFSPVYETVPEPCTPGHSSIAKHRVRAPLFLLSPWRVAVNSPCPAAYTALAGGADARISRDMFGTVCQFWHMMRRMIRRGGAAAAAPRSLLQAALDDPGQPVGQRGRVVLQEGVGPAHAADAGHADEQ